jgi:hypothetical protein
MQQLLSAQTACVSMTAGTTASAALPLPVKLTTLRVVNEGPNTAFIAVGTSQTVLATLPPALGTVTPSTTSTCVLAGSDVDFSLPDDQVYYFSAITRSGTAVLDIQVGEGV